jgi:hypothetical protein
MYVLGKVSFLLGFLGDMKLRLFCLRYSFWVDEIQLFAAETRMNVLYQVELEG